MGLSDDMMKAEKKAKEEKAKSAVAKPAAEVVKSETKGLQRLEKMKEAQQKALAKKTHQDLINACYKAAEKLEIAPWVLIRAAGWGHFTDDRGALYKGLHIVDIETLEIDQKKALVDEIFGAAGNWDQIKKLIES